MNEEPPLGQRGRAGRRMVGRVSLIGSRFQALNAEAGIAVIPSSIPVAVVEVGTYEEAKRALNVIPGGLDALNRAAAVNFDGASQERASLPRPAIFGVGRSLGNCGIDSENLCSMTEPAFAVAPARRP